MSTLTLRHEPMSPIFDKWHVDGLGAPAVLHRFAAPDDGDAHDHPFDFTTTIISGGYVEEVFRVLDAGQWVSAAFTRLPGSSHHVAATTIHRIIRLLDDECWTMILPGPVVRETRFWRFGVDGASSRHWTER